MERTGETNSRAGVPWALRGMVIASVALPLLVFACGAWFDWRAIKHAATDSLVNQLSVACEQATRVLDTHMLLGARVNDLVGGLGDDAISEREHELHDRLIAMIAGMSQVSAVAITGSDGQPLIATSQYPVDHSVSFNNQPYFKAIRDTRASYFIGGVIPGRLTGANEFVVASRRGSDPDQFSGVIIVGVPPSYFSDFDREMFGGSGEYTARIMGEDGLPLAGYPEPATGAASDLLLMRSVAIQPNAGLVQGGSLLAYRKLTNYPVYVTVGRRWGSIIEEWRNTMATHLIFGIPATLALFALSLLTMQQWRRQRGTLARLQDEVQRRETAEEALRQSQKMEAVGRLTGGIAHDFNNHLTVISSNIELLQRRLPPDSGSLARLSEAAMAGVQRAATLTHRLLAFSRQQPLEPEPLDVGRLVSNISDLLRRTLGESISVETVLAAGLWQIRVDANQLENVLLNLVVNARDAMPSGGKLTIETANAYLDHAYAASHSEVTAGQYVMLAVTDTGTGMTQDIIDKAFEPFFTTKPLGQGTGLGLSMVYGFVRQSGGHVAIHSEAGQGSSVKVYLPRFVRSEARPDGKDRSTVAPRAGGTGETILVVEDDEEVRRASVEALREIGYQVLEASDAMEGVRLIVDRGGIDLLFTDVGLPGGVNGRALADAARSAQPGVRVLYTTGYTRNEILHGAMSDQRVHFIAKPFTLAALAAKIREVLDNPAAEPATEETGV